MMNTHVRDNLLWAAFHHGCRAWKSGAQTVGAGNTDLVTFNSESYDTDAMHNTGSNTGRFVAPVSGYYEATFQPTVDADSSHHNGRFVLSFRKNAAGASGGGTALATVSVPPHAITQGGIIHWQGFLTAADYIEAFFQSATEARDLTATEDGTSFEFTFLGF